LVCHSFNLEIGAVKTIIGNRCLMIALFACVVKGDREAGALRHRLYAGTLCDCLWHCGVRDRILLPFK
jgi:hypothetical protein